MINFKDLFRRQKAAGQVHVQTKPSPGANHEHKFFEMPCDMGRKVYRVCQVSGCKHSETVNATAEQQEAVTPVADAVRGFQDQVLSDVAEELGRRRKHR